MGNVLVACEFSGVVREAFASLGHKAMSCDLLPTEQPCSALAEHYQGDIRDVLGMDWDLMIAHPPCTHLAVSGARYFSAKRADGRQEAALDFVRLLLAAAVPRIALENPVSVISSAIRKPDQIIQPWQFGHEATKATCLWLKGLPPLVPTAIVGKGTFKTYASGRRSADWHARTGGGSGHKRSVTYQGIAEAMATQWGPLL